MISPLMEEAIRRIVRDEIAQDEMRRIEQERRGARSAMVPGNPPPPPGTIWFGYDPGESEGGEQVYTLNGSRLLDFDPARLDAIERELGA